MSTQEEREAEVEALMARLLDENDPYDAHHGTDRSEDSLQWLSENDPETYVRILGKIAAEEATNGRS